MSMRKKECMLPQTNALNNMAHRSASFYDLLFCSSFSPPSPSSSYFLFSLVLLFICDNFYREKTQRNLRSLCTVVTLVVVVRVVMDVVD